LWPPARPNGRTVVTTRRRDAALPGHPIDIGLFTKGEAADYLRAKLAARGRHDDPAQVAALARDLGHLPLALAQAATYLLDLHLDCATYRARLADRARTLPDLVPEEGSLPDATAPRWPPPGPCPSNTPTSSARQAWPAPCSTWRPCSTPTASPPPS